MIAQLELFERRLPRKPYCTDDLQSGLMIRPARTASRKKYIQANPPWLRSWLIFDVDRHLAPLAWELAGLPEPYWVSVNPENNHAHLSFGLEAPVLLGQHDRQRPMRYLAAVETAMRAAMEADPGYSGLITKNPANPHWLTNWSLDAGIYKLSWLSEFVDLPRYIDRRHRPEEVGLGRNVTVFDHIRHLAYRSIRGWKARREQGIFIRWQCHLYDQALQRNGDFGTPMDHRECYHIAKSVARWVWTKFDIEASDAQFSALQAHRGRKGGRPAMEDKQASARLMRAQGMSVRAIAVELGASKSAVAKWLAK